MSVRSINPGINIRKGNIVPLRTVYAALTLSLVAALIPLRSVQAETVIYNSAGFIQGQQSFVQSFDITTAGTVTVTLSNIPWLDTISGLNCFLTTSSGLLAPSMGVGTESMNVEPGVYYAHWLGDANGGYGVGVYGLDITFQPSGVTPVALPTSSILLLSGLGLVFGWQRRLHPQRL